MEAFTFTDSKTWRIVWNIHDRVTSRLQLTACASLAEPIADITPTATHAAVMARIAKAR